MTVSISLYDASVLHHSTGLMVGTLRLWTKSICQEKLTTSVPMNELPNVKVLELTYIATLTILPEFHRRKKKRNAPSCRCVEKNAVIT